MSVTGYVLSVDADLDLGEVWDSRISTSVSRTPARGGKSKILGVSRNPTRSSN
jgi:hypothetical protein